MPGQGLGTVVALYGVSVARPELRVPQNLSSIREAEAGQQPHVESEAGDCASAGSSY